MSLIKQNIVEIMSELPPGVKLVAVAKTRSPGEIIQAVDAGIRIIGENYVQEAERAYTLIGNKVQWHLIGHLQKNKVKKAVGIFDMIETIDSIELAVAIDERCSQVGKVMPVLIEVNSGREPQKTGVFPEAVEQLVRDMAVLVNIRVMGLMTMGPRFGDPEDSRSFFVVTKKIFDYIKELKLPGVNMKYLSMGMTNSYRVAIQEGANIIRVGSGIFAEREN